MKQQTFYRFFFFCKIFSGLLLFLLLSHVKASGQGLPSAPKKMIETGIENWNNIYGANVKARGWTYEGVIKTEKQRNEIVLQMTKTSNNWFPSGDVKKPALMTAFRITDDPSVKNTAITAWQDMIRSKVKIGQHLVKIKWTKGSLPFTSICVTDENSVVYDNMLSNTAYTDHNSVCFDYRIGNFLQTKYEDMDFGEIKAELKIKCVGGKPICDKSCNSKIALGEIKINCNVETKGNCCQLTWSYGWATGLKSIKVGVDGFSIEVGGILGSSGQGEGSCTECCPDNVTTETKTESQKQTDKTAEELKMIIETIRKLLEGLFNNVSNLAQKEEIRSIINSLPPATPLMPVQTPGGSVGVDGPQKVRTISIKTLSGEVVDVKVPNIIRPGDQISGSVVTKPNSSTLQGAVVDVENNKTNVKDKIFKFIVPAGLASIPFLIKNEKGETLGMTEIPVNRPNIPTPGNHVTLPPRQIEITPPHAPGSFAPMNYCQPGEPLTINGFFDGNASNTKVSINNIPCEIITESNTASFVNIPVTLTAGRASLTIQEGGVTQTMPIQVITTNLSANKTTLTKAAKAEIKFTVSGLDGLKLADNHFKMQLTNQSPSNISFNSETGNIITRNITESDVKNGVYNFTTTVTGISTALLL